MIWRERIQAARERGRFTEDDLFDAGVHKYTQPYARCAVGEQADRYGADLIFEWPEDRIGPIDQELRDLGAQFCGEISVHNFINAERLLDAIEDRALELKRASLT